MVEEILPDLYRIEIPLPDSPLKYLNSYVLRSAERNLIVDTGLNRSACLNAMNIGLRELNIDLNRTDFFITHLHADHFGLVNRLTTDNSRIYFNRPDAELIETWEGFEPMIKYAGTNGFPENQLRAALQQHPGHKFASDWNPDLSILSDGDIFPIGDYRFRCIETPGHTPGHICLYEPAKKFIIAGDHILGDITPNIQCWSDNTNPLKQYLASLDKVFDLEVELVLPGHRRLFRNYRERINELKDHHENRIDEVRQILVEGPKTGFQLAAKMKWDIDCDSWEQFPVAQKWFATGEAIAHLRYLEQQHKIAREPHSKIITYALNDQG
jgi:glyoxylase-like metal-dependent hydrolase (beta-lactamase superfamily II)